MDALVAFGTVASRAMCAPRQFMGCVMMHRALVSWKNSSYVAWVCVGTGAVFLVLALPLAALGAFVVGACCAYAARRKRRR